MTEHRTHVEALQDAMSQFWELRALALGARELLVHGDENQQNAAFLLLDMAGRLADQYGAEAWEAWERSEKSAHDRLAQDESAH